MEKKIALNSAVAAATGLKRARERFQAVALLYVAQQSIVGNADAATRIMSAADMIGPKGLTADGRRVARYLIEGVKLPLTISPDSSGFKMAKDWTERVQSIDWETLTTTPFWAWSPLKAAAPAPEKGAPEKSAPEKGAPEKGLAKKAKPAFDLARRAASLVRLAQQAGISLSEISDTMAAAVAAAGQKAAEAAEAPQREAA